MVPVAVPPTVVERLVVSGAMPEAGTRERVAERVGANLVAVQLAFDPPPDPKQVHEAELPWAGKAGRVPVPYEQAV